MHGIDVSSWQAGIIPSNLEIDFCISKATESNDYVNPYCNEVIQDCIKHDIPFGYYHYGLNRSAKDEARWFWNNTLGYTGFGIPILDYEEWANNSVSWCETFIEEYHRLSSVWPLLYISGSRCSLFNDSWIPKKCGLWLAAYPKDYPDWPSISDCPYNGSPWEFIAIWQFASDWNMEGYKGDLDANIANMDRTGWAKYAKGGIKAGNANSGSTEKANRKSCEELAEEVLQGKWGSGYNRKTALDGAYGKGTYDHVQCIVNQKLGLDGC